MVFFRTFFISRVTVFNILLLFILAGSMVFINQAEADSVKGKVSNLSEIVEDFSKKQKNLRIAVLDFHNTANRKTRFDGYIADSLVTELTRKKFTVLERKRLRSVMNEYALKQTGVVSSDNAMKLGRFLPVDVIVTGSYTAIGKRIEINGRFIHVVTGKIVYAFSGYLNVDPSEIGAKPDYSSGKKACDSVHEPVLEALKNLKTEDEIRLAVKRAVSVPFDEKCGMIHEKVIYSFSKYKIYPDRYKKFLIKTIKSIDNPSQDRRASSIMYYFASDKKVDSDEWDASMAALKRTTGWTSRRYLSYMYNNKVEDPARVISRVDEVMKLARAGKIGKPVPLTPERVFFDTASSLRNYQKHNLEVITYTLKKYINMVPDNEKSNKKALRMLRTAYFIENNESHKRKAQVEILAVMIDFIKERKISGKLTDELLYTIRNIESRIDTRYKRKEHIALYYEKDLKKINSSLRQTICSSYDYLVKEGSKYGTNKLKEYILKNSIQCKKGPSLKSLIDDMQSRDWKRKVSAAKMFSKLGEGARGAEGTIIRYLGQKGFGRDGGTMRRYLAMTLGNIKTKNPRGIRVLIGAFSEYGHSVSSEAKKSINKIGIKALPYLIEGLKHKERPVRYGCAEAIGSFGGRARKALPALKRLERTGKDSYLKKRARESIQMIENDY